MNEFEFPTNIKQIGSIGEGLRIYIEDYAYSYLQQFVDMPGFETRLAFLVGRHLVIDGQDVLFISGVIRGSDTDTERGIHTFTARSFENARREIERYFGNLEVVGWMYSQPGFGLGMPPEVQSYHWRTFSRDSDVCLVMDGEQKLCAFYIRRGDGLAEAKGFFVYYDKNRGMHEYMLDNKVSKIRVVSAKGKGLRGEGEEEGHDGRPSSEVAVERIRNNYSKRNSAEAGHRPAGGQAPGKPRSAGIIRLPMLARGRRPPRMRLSPQRQLGLVATLCAVLFVATVAMGAGLVQNVERLQFLERQVTDLGTAYRNLMMEVGGGAVPVAAPGAPVDTQDEQGQAEDIPSPSPSPSPGPAEAPTPSVQAPLLPEPQDQAVPEPQAQGPINIEEVISQLQNIGSAQSGYDSQEQGLSVVPLEYVVVAGDTLSEISRRFYGTTDRMADIMEYNGISDPNDIMVGSTLRLPRR